MEIRKIGSYLIENQTCNEQVIDTAISRQLALKHQGIYKPIGQIIIDNGDLKPEVLDSILHRQGEDLLRSVELFKSFSPELISKIAGIAECIAFSKGQVIIHEGDPGDSFFQIISGLTRVFRTSEDSIEVTLATIGPGESFGEMALLTGEPRSASVETIEPSGILVISKRSFDQLAAENPEFLLAISKVLSSRLAQGGFNLVSATSTEKAYQRFVSEQSKGPESRLIGRSKIIKRLQTKIQEVARNDKPVLVTGEPGTEKHDVAGLIHLSNTRKDTPFLAVDVKTINLGRSAGRPIERDPIRIELAQNSTFFGHAKDAFSFASEKRLGLFQVGNDGTVMIENIEYLADSVQAKLADFIQHGHFRRLGDQTDLHSLVRVVATSAVDLSQLVQDGKFNRQLFNLLGGSQVLSVPPLRKRKKDLRQLVEHLVEQYGEQAGKSVTGIELDAYKSIMSYDWPGNTDELKVVIRRAVNLVQGRWLTPEDILIGTAPQITGKLSFNLLKLDRVRQLFQNKAFPNSAQLATACIFMLIIFLGFFGRQVPGFNPSLELTWGLWEPLVIFSCILAAKIWCAVCPVGASCSLISRKFGLNRSIPSFIRNYGAHLAAAGLGLIFLSEVVFNMPFSPQATAGLLLSIALPAVILALIYRRRVWCRFLCPLGKLVGFIASCSFLELRANHNICNNDCMENSCYVGNENQEGCPIFEAPFAFNNNQNCIMCGICIKNCPNQSPTLNLRIPGHELWNFHKPDQTMALFGTFLMGTQLFRGLEKSGYLHHNAAAFSSQWIFFTVFFIVTVFFAFVFARTAGRVVFDSINLTSPKKAALMSYAFVPLVIAFELSFHFERLISRGGQLIPTLGRQFGFNWEFLGVSFGLWLVKFCQVLFILTGVFAAKSVLKRLLRFQQHTVLQHLSWRQQLPILLLATGYIWLFLIG